VARRADAGGGEDGASTCISRQSIASIRSPRSNLPITRYRLPAGVLTLYQQGGHGAAYLGDARLAAFPVGDKRLLSYAVDQKVALDRDSSERRFITKATITEGVMRLARLSRQTTTYRIKAAVPATRADDEHPRLPGWTLSTPDPKTVDITANAYRIRADLGGKNEGSLAVVEDRPVEETIALSDLADNRLDVLAQSRTRSAIAHRH